MQCGSTVIYAFMTPHQLFQYVQPHDDVPVDAVHSQAPNGHLETRSPHGSHLACVYCLLLKSRPQTPNGHLGTRSQHGSHLACEPSELDALLAHACIHQAIDRLDADVFVAVGVVWVPLDEAALQLPNELEVLVMHIALVDCTQPLELLHFANAQPGPVEECDQHVHGTFDLAELYHVIEDAVNHNDVACQKTAGNNICTNLGGEGLARLHERLASS